MGGSNKNLSDIGSIVLVGAGKMGMSMAKGWIAKGLLPNNLTLIDPNPHQSVKQYAKQHEIKLISNIENINAQILVLAVKPQIMDEIFPKIKKLVSEKTLVLSIAAGIEIKTLKNALKTNNIVRAMPNTPSQIGKGVSGIVAALEVSKSDKAIIDALLTASGTIEWLENESELEALMLVSGCGPAYVFLLVEAMAEAGVELGLKPSQAMALARQTVIGAAALMEAEPTDAANLRQNVTSKGGVTEAALSVLIGEGGFKPLLIKAFKKGLERNKELGS